MNKPTDYPLDTKVPDSITDTPASGMTYAILQDRVRKEKPITDEMINIARTRMDTAHVDISASQSTSTPLKSRFSSIRERFKAN